MSLGSEGVSMESIDPTTVTTVSDGAAAGILAFAGIIWLVSIVFLVIMIVAMWKVFVKAGKPGWASIIPIYNIIVMLEIIGRPIWWIVLFLIPLVNIVISIMVMLDMAKAFGKSVVFAIFGLILFSPIGWLMLGFGKAEYVGAPNQA
jgi:hypothetical protein